MLNIFLNKKMICLFFFFLKKNIAHTSQRILIAEASIIVIVFLIVFRRVVVARASVLMRALLFSWLGLFVACACVCGHNKMMTCEKGWQSWLKIQRKYNNKKKKTFPPTCSLFDVDYNCALWGCILFDLEIQHFLLFLFFLCLVGDFELGMKM